MLINNKISKPILLLVWVFAFVILTSCRSKKETVYEKEYLTVHDTVIKEKLIIKTEKVTDTFEIEKPCSEKGEIKPFNQKILTDAGFVHVYSRNGKIYAKLDIKGTEQLKEKEVEIKYIEKEKIVLKDKLITKYKYPIWLVVWFIFTLIFFLYRFYRIFKK